MEKNIPTVGLDAAQNSRTADSESTALTMIYEALGSARWTVYAKPDGSVNHVCWSDELRRLRDDLAAANKRYHDQMKVIGGMCIEYGTVWLIHVPEMTPTLYQNTGDRVVQAAVGEGERINSYEEALAGYAKRYVHEEDREKFLRNVSYAVVREQIRRKAVYRVTYRRFMHNKLEYYQICFAHAAASDYSEDFVVGFRNVDDEVREDRQRQDAMEAALAAAEKANESKTVFLNNISHDIRTPMNGIIGLTAIAGAHLDDRERVKECLVKISAASSHLLSLINDVLDVSRIESDKVSLAEEEFSLSDQFDSMVNMISPQIKAKKQELSVEIGHIIHEDVIGDPVRLQQVFMNIVGNASKYTPDGGHISICLKEDTESSDNYSKYIFICKDDGYGMKPLFRSRLEMTLRDVIAGEKPKDSGNVLKEYVGKDYSDKRILLVEDNELNREISVEILGMTGAQIETAEDGHQALACFESHAPGYYDLIFIDIQMPVMDGLQAMRAIRQLRRADALTIPIVAMSANAFTEDMESSKRAGMNDHIAKPVSLPKLLGVMENYLGTRAAAFVWPEQNKAPAHTVTFAKYYERLFVITGTAEIPEEAKCGCIDALNHNGAVGIFGLIEEKDYPIYFCIGFCAAVARLHL